MNVALFSLQPSKIHGTGGTHPRPHITNQRRHTHHAPPAKDHQPLLRTQGRRLVIGYGHPGAVLGSDPLASGHPATDLGQSDAAWEARGTEASLGHHPG